MGVGRKSAEPWDAQRKPLANFGGNESEREVPKPTAIEAAEKPLHLERANRAAQRGVKAVWRGRPRQRHLGPRGGTRS
ncbi:hypothetical protein ZHAS_00001198 [Anopheles sinensis]|uniref:Uncharacterized protein n=1 Tax=Anopheles sinensis TaxID=74873 RepID=A0A084VB57_ANOSI|nr:hypothetical protein ZHAS_00001198 [Anopheles sinensis]